MMLSCIILALTKDQSSYQMTKECVDSLINSVGEVELEIILVESNPHYDPVRYPYGDQVKVVNSPEGPFNFHRSLNWGAEYASGDYLAFCNNDLIFHNAWFDAMLEVASNSKFKAFSPVDPKDPKLPNSVTQNRQWVEGYEIQKHFKGWCFVIKREVLEITGPFDERFDFYFADNDFCMCMKKHGVRHCAVMNSRVQHLPKSGQEPVSTDSRELLEELGVDPSSIPSYVLKENRYWLVANEKMIDGLIKFHKKWGSHRAIKVKDRLAKFCVQWKMSFLLPMVYSSN